MINEVKQLLQQKNAVLVAHYYVDGAIQDLAEQSNGIVADSLEMARFGKNSTADILIIAGVKFMGETAKILSPEKTVLLIDKDAACSLDDSCNLADFKIFCAKNPDREIVVYANTSAQIKAYADWTVTSGSAVAVINYLKQHNKKIIWAPDKYLGSYVRQQTKADMLLWNGSCIVHEKFKADAIIKLKKKYPNSVVLVHPESPKEVIATADIVGSTTTLINTVKNCNNNIFIVATDNGIFHKMQQIKPQAKLIIAPTMGEGADCESCAHCKWMAKNTIAKLLQVLKNETNEVHLTSSVIHKAQQSINKLLNFTEQQNGRT